MSKTLISLSLLAAFSWLPWFTGDDKPDETAKEDTENPETPTNEAQEPEVVEEPPPPEPPSPLLFPDPLPLHGEQLVSGLGMVYASSCGGCHAKSLEEWNDSAHHIGFQDKELIESIRSYGNGTVCTQCHLPLAQQHEKITVSVVEEDVARPVMEENPAWNPTLTLDSVGCASCHVRQGVVVGRKTSDSPHAVRNSQELVTSEACKSCHQYTLPEEETPLYNTFLEWKNSAYYTAGIQCQDCHMRDSSPTIGEGHRNHTMSLPIKQGITITYSISSFEIQRNKKTPFSFTLHNTGVGHSWPSSSPFIEKKLIIRVYDSKGKSAMKEKSHYIGRQPTEIAEKLDPIPTSIAVGNQRAYANELLISSRYPAGVGRIEIIYKEGEEETLLDQIRVQIR